MHSRSNPLLVAFVAMTLIGASCKKEEPKKEEERDPNPTACFDPDTYLKAPGMAVFFKNCSSNFDRVEWDFGDGQSSTISEPSHVWSKRGIYQVSLKSFKNNVPASASKKIMVSAGVSLTFSRHVWIDDPENNWPYDSLQYDVYIKKDTAQKFTLLKKYNHFKPYLEDSASTTYPVASDVRAKYRFKLVMRDYHSAVNAQPVDSFTTKDINLFEDPSKYNSSGDLKFSKIGYCITITY